jgi:hypothetical protein
MITKIFLIEFKKLSIMKMCYILTYIFLSLSFSFGQVKSGNFSGNLVEEWVWSKTKDDYIMLESIPMKTKIQLSKTHIYFKKGEHAKWLQNKWNFDKTLTSDNGTRIDRYYDERAQLILIDYKESQIWYYYNWDVNLEVYLNIATYKNLKEDEVSNQDESEQRNQEVIAKFIITEATVNGEDNTSILREQGAYTVFYKFENDDLIHMANYWPKANSQSFGPMYSAENTTYEETYESYKADVFHFNWRYTNDYDDKKGTAKVQLTKVFKPKGVSFILKIIPENLDIIIYKGYMEGTVDFSKY